jgi:hypothetical protein
MTKNAPSDASRRRARLAYLSLAYKTLRELQEDYELGIRRSKPALREIARRDGALAPRGGFGSISPFWPCTDHFRSSR